MKSILWIAALLTSITAFASDDDCLTKYKGKVYENFAAFEYKGDVDKAVTFTVEDWSEAAEKAEINFDRRITIHPVKAIDGMSFYGGALAYGEKTEFHMTLSFQGENGEKTAWFLSSPEAVKKITIVLWYSNEKCHMKIVVPLKDNKAINLAPAAPNADTKRRQ